jgi:hypothetical protein
MSEMTYTVDLGIAGEVECIVRFDYQPEERMTYDYPGCSESYDVYEVIGMFGGLPRDLTFALADVLNDHPSFADAVHQEMNPEPDDAPDDWRMAA